jgi:hypothetical protein
MSFRDFKKIVYREAYIVVSFFLVWFLLNLAVMSQISASYQFHQTLDRLIILLYACYWAGRLVMWLTGKMRGA